MEEAKLVLALDFFNEPLVEALPGWLTGNTQLAKHVFRCLRKSLLFIAASACFAKEEKCLGDEFRRKIESSSRWVDEG
jgi:hypothetical protein